MALLPGLPGKIQDAQLHLNFRLIFSVRVSQILPGCLAFLFADCDTLPLKSSAQHDCSSQEIKTAKGCGPVSVAVRTVNMTMQVGAWHRRVGILEKGGQGTRIGHETFHSRLFTVLSFAGGPYKTGSSRLCGCLLTLAVIR